MVTAVPACIVWEPTRQAADSDTKTLGWSFRKKKNFTDSEAKSGGQFTPRRYRTLRHDQRTSGGTTKSEEQNNLNKSRFNSLKKLLYT